MADSHQTTIGFRQRTFQRNLQFRKTVVEVKTRLLLWVWILSSPTTRGEPISMILREFHGEAQEEVVGRGATAVVVVAVVRLVIPEEDHRGRRKIQIQVVADRLADLKSLRVATRGEEEEEDRLEIRILPKISSRGNPHAHKGLGPLKKGIIFCWLCVFCCRSLGVRACHRTSAHCLYRGAGGSLCKLFKCAQVLSVIKFTTSNCSRDYRRDQTEQLYVRQPRSTFTVVITTVTSLDEVTEGIFTVGLLGDIGSVSAGFRPALTVAGPGRGRRP